MIDILVYLFENYLPDACPEPEVLARKLSAAGFGSDDISEALSWLDGLAVSQGAPCSHPHCQARSESTTRKNRNACRLPVAVSSPSSNSMTPSMTPLREAIIERALALPDAEISPGPAQGHRTGRDLALPPRSRCADPRRTARRGCRRRGFEPAAKDVTRILLN
jgi:Smg protein